MSITFGGKKTAGGKKQLSYHFRKANVSCQIRGIQPVPYNFLLYIFYHIRTDKKMLAHTNIPFKGHSEIREAEN